MAAGRRDTNGGSGLVSGAPSTWRREESAVDEAESLLMEVEAIEETLDALKRMQAERHESDTRWLESMMTTVQQKLVERTQERAHAGLPPGPSVLGSHLLQRMRASLAAGASLGNVNGGGVIGNLPLQSLQAVLNSLSGGVAGDLSVGGGVYALGNSVGQGVLGGGGFENGHLRREGGSM